MEEEHAREREDAYKRAFPSMGDNFRIETYWSIPRLAPTSLLFLSGKSIFTTLGYLFLGHRWGDYCRYTRRYGCTSTLRGRCFALLLFLFLSYRPEIFEEKRWMGEVQYMFAWIYINIPSSLDIAPYIHKTTLRLMLPIITILMKHRDVYKYINIYYINIYIHIIYF